MNGNGIIGEITITGYPYIPMDAITKSKNCLICKKEIDYDDIGISIYKEYKQCKECFDILENLGKINNEH